MKRLDKIEGRRGLDKILGSPGAGRSAFKRLSTIGIAIRTGQFLPPDRGAGVRGGKSGDDQLLLN
jgi:hypothetical protein